MRIALRGMILVRAFTLAGRNIIHGSGKDIKDLGHAMIKSADDE